MDNSKDLMNVKTEVKILLLKKCWTMKKLAEELSKITGKYYSQQNLNYRLSSNSLKLSEMAYICKLLGYKIVFAEEEKQ